MPTCIHDCSQRCCKSHFDFFLRIFSVYRVRSVGVRATRHRSHDVCELRRRRFHIPAWPLPRQTPQMKLLFLQNAFRVVVNSADAHVVIRNAAFNLRERRLRESFTNCTVALRGSLDNGVRSFLVDS